MGYGGSWVVAASVGAESGRWCGKGGTYRMKDDESLTEWASEG